MSWKGWMVLVAVGIPSLACGGMGSDEVFTALDPNCGVEQLPPHTIELVQLERDLPSPKLAVTLEVGPDHWVLDQERLPVDPVRLKERLAEKAAFAKELGARAGSEDFQFKGELLLLLPPDLAMGELLPLLQAAHEAQFGNVGLIVRTKAKPSIAYVDAEYGAGLEKRLEGLPADQRAMTMADEVSGLLVACPPAQQAFAAVATAPAELKCRMIAQGLAEALPTCPVTNHAKVVTSMQVMTKGARWEFGKLTLSLDPEGTPYEVDPAKPWSEVAPWWADQEVAGPTWWVAQGALPEE